MIALVPLTDTLLMTGVTRVTVGFKAIVTLQVALMQLPSCAVTIIIDVTEETPVTTLAWLTIVILRLPLVQLMIY